MRLTFKKKTNGITTAIITTSTHPNSPFWAAAEGPRHFPKRSIPCHKNSPAHCSLGL